MMKTAMKMRFVLGATLLNGCVSLPVQTPPGGVAGYRTSADGAFCKILQVSVFKTREECGPPAYIPSLPPAPPALSAQNPPADLVEHGSDPAADLPDDARMQDLVATLGHEGAYRHRQAGQERARRQRPALAGKEAGPTSVQPVGAAPLPARVAPVPRDDAAAPSYRDSGGSSGPGRQEGFQLRPLPSQGAGPVY